MKDVPFHRSIYARLMFWAMAVSLAVTLLLWAVTAETIRRTGTEALARAIDVDLAGLADIYASGGRAELERRIGDRLALASPDGDAPHYMLADDAGRRLAGDIGRWPALDASLSQAGPITLANGVPAQARATRLAPGLRLLVVREHGRDSQLIAHVRLAFVAAGLVAVLAVGLLGRMLARRLARRIGRVSRALREQDDASLDALSDDRGAGDEIGELTRHSAAALARLKRMVSAHRETSDQIAHELRTPLMHLDTRIVRAARSAQDDGLRDMLADARGQIRRIVAMLESLLDIATSEARKGDRQGLAPVNLSLLAERLADLYADSAEESGHRFIVAIAPGVVIDGEEMQLTRLLTNLLDNAFKFVPPGGTVRLALDPGPRLSVADDGPGIPAEDAGRIFGRFERGLRTPADGQGAGLGLALARAIAERHGLTLGLAPSECGATFLLEPEAE